MRKQVILEHKPAGATGFTQLGDAVTTGAEENFSFDNVQPAESTEYRARFAGDERARLNSSVSNVETVTVSDDNTGTPVNEAPTAKGDSYNTDEETKLTVNATDGVLKNDTDAENDTLKAVVVDTPRHGTLGLKVDGSFVYTPDQGHTGEDAFTYKANDGTTESNAAKVTINVNAVNDLPTADAAGPYQVNEGGSVSVKASGDDPEGGALTYKWDLDNDGTFETSEQNATFSAADLDGPSTQTIKVQVADPEGASATDEATIEVKNAAPTITGISNASQALMGKPVSFTGTATDPSKADASAGFKWQWALDGGTSSTDLNPFKSEFSTCGEHTVSAKAQDKDGGLSEPVRSDAVSVYEAHFQQPLDEGVNNTVKSGGIVPVKISIGCGGSDLTGLKPVIQLLKGDQTEERETSSEAIETLASSADTTRVMRPDDGGYTYNLKVPGNARSGAKFTILVRPFGNDNTEASMYVVVKIK